MNCPAVIVNCVMTIGQLMRVIIPVAFDITTEIIIHGSRRHRRSVSTAARGREAGVLSVGHVSPAGRGRQNNQFEILNVGIARA